MQIEIKNDDSIKPEDWNSAVSRSKTAHIYNTIEWAKIIETSMGYKPIYYTAEENGKIIGCFHIFEKTAIPCGIAKHISKIRYSYAPPVIISENKKEIFIEMITAVLSDAKNNNIASVNIWDTPYMDESEMFKSMGFVEEEKHNVLIDLNGTEEEIFKRLDKGLRKNIRHALESGATFIDTPTHEDLKEYYKLYEEHHRHLEIAPYPFTYVQAIWDYLITKNLAKFLIIKYNGKIGAGIIFSAFNSRMYEMSVASAAEYHSFFPNDLLKWKAIEWGIKNSYELFDISNVPVNPAEGTKEHGILRFKKKWGRIAAYHGYKKTGILGKLWNIKKMIKKSG